MMRRIALPLNPWRKRERGSLAVLFVLLIAACSANSESSPRCALCGMRVDPRSGWRSGGTASDGRELQFDSPKCLFRYRMERGGVRRPWVIEYYAQQRRNAEGLFYVEGSDLAGPMGPDLVPVHEHAAAERFSSDHHGRRVLAYRDVSRAVVDSLFRPNN